MNSLVSKLKNYVIGLELRWSDLFLLVGFLLSLPFFVFVWQFMTTANPDEILFKPWMIVTCFLLIVVSWGLYFFLEIRKGNLKANTFTWLFIFFLFMGVISVIVQPAHQEISVTARLVNNITQQYYPGINVGDAALVVTDISSTHYLFFAFTSVILTTLFFIVFIVFPKRIKSLNVLYLTAVIVFVLMLVLTFYSYIAEHAKYGPFLKALFTGDIDGVYNNSMMSFATHRVTYAKYLMGGMVFALILQAYSNKWYWYLPAIYCFINIFFTWGKAAIAFSAITFVLYLVYRLFATFKKHDRRNVLLALFFGEAVIIFAVLCILSVSSNGEIIPQLKNLLDSLSDSRTITSRTYIWDNIIQRLNEGWWPIGRGLGVHNYLLYPMNLVNGDATALSHSSYYAVLGANGVVGLVGYLGLHIYFGYAFYKCFKVDKYLTIGLSVGVFGFFIYSFTEGVNYLLMPSMIPLFIYYSMVKRGLAQKR